ncbi:MAG TPA: hypothetical protein VGJ77_10995 [Gaiellaceae bacterium]
MKSVVVALLVALVGAPAALAHGSGSKQGWVSSVERIVNAGGIQAEASGDGHFKFTAPAGKTVIVDGYSNEPYLRFAGGKVYENELAPTAYVNRDEPVPPRADAKAAPRWNEAATGRTYTWHDHRTHWMGTNEPAAVQRDPHKAHHIFDWRVSGTVDAKRFAIIGSLDWAPTKSGLGWQWLLVPVLGAALLYGLFVSFVAARRRGTTARPA